MSWGKIDDKARGNAKLRAVGKSVRGCLLMVWAYCAEQGSDGWVPDWVAAQEFTAAELRVALTVTANGTAPLLHSYGDLCRCLVGHKWTEDMGGYWVHDWLVYNPSKSENKVHKAKRRELNDADLRYEVKRRDGNACRYCGVVSPWNDNRSARSLSVEHINPLLADGLSNLIVACCGCNSRKRDALTPEAVGLALLPPPTTPPPAGGWPKGTDPASIERAWPEPDRDPERGPTAIEPTDRPLIGSRSERGPDRDPTTDPHPGHTPARSTADQAVPTTPRPGGQQHGAQPPGTGRDGSGGRLPPGEPPGRVGPPTTRRSAHSPSPYRKSATTNPYAHGPPEPGPPENHHPPTGDPP